MSERQYRFPDSWTDYTPKRPDFKQFYDVVNNTGRVACWLQDFAGKPGFMAMSFYLKKKRQRIDIDVHQPKLIM